MTLNCLLDVLMHVLVIFSTRYDSMEIEFRFFYFFSLKIYRTTRARPATALRRTIPNFVVFRRIDLVNRHDASTL